MTTYMQKAVAGKAAITADLGEGWTVDLDSLDMMSPWRCTLGQAYGSSRTATTFCTNYSKGLDALAGKNASWDERHAFALSHGFVAGTDQGYRRLDAAWRELLQ